MTIIFFLVDVCVSTLGLLARFPLYYLRYLHLFWGYLPPEALYLFTQITTSIRCTKKGKLIHNT